MGFFFSRKSDQDDPTSTKENGRPIAAAGESGFKSLRTRFQVYAKKLDTKERDSPPPLFSQPMSVAQTLSPAHATPIANRHLQLKLKLSSSSPALNDTRYQIRPDRAKSANASSATNRHSMHTSNSEPSASRSRALGTKASSSSLAATPPSRPQSDNITTTLAQRLNELAAANSEGLLNDDEYRLLRQDLFQRFASTTVVPTEAPVVPVASKQGSRSVRINGAQIPSNKRQSIDSNRLSISTASNFILDKQPAPSIHSRSSMTSGVASLFRRATGRHPSRDYSDSSSIFSATSAAPSESTKPLKRLSKKKSDSSLTTDRGDSVSISSRRTNNHNSPTESSKGSASVRSVRHLPTPPSSFPTRLPGVESRYAGMAPEPDASADANTSDTAQALRREIIAVEAEARRHMDSFSGLELTALTKRRRTAAVGPRESVATLVPSDARSVTSRRRLRSGSDAADGDAASMRSATSAATSVSMTSRRGTRNTMLKPGGAVVPGASCASSSRVALRRENSVSSIGSATSRFGTGSGGGSGSGGLMVPPVPSLPLGMSLSQMGSTQSLSRSTGHLPMSVLHENEPVLTVDLDDEREFGKEMEELRRRREEVAARYEARLDYLRAKLKGAELHEKLLSK
ncbi:hypothetical protein GGX14DRAFT_448496 [Mycena pura]|uniref:Uncharacterized protein n=1 Tax=Mycena pura TaxID=153505 RepID=A0AAD6VGS5_9AGAR|nr:hypothetical protein GGX14DRAFT_448496 [Mycena pura]